MPNKFSLYLKLMRLNSPTGYLLVFFPSFFGIMLANPFVDDLTKLLPLFFIGSIFTRSSGCIINDIFDQDFDRYVARTKDRPLANGLLDAKDAITLLIILLFCSLLILLLLNKTAIYLGLLAFFMIMLYPLMKRITNLAQVFLGLTFNLGVLIGYSAVSNKLSIEAFIMYIACCSWTIGYDTIYGFMDLADDKKINVKSMALLLEDKNYKFHLLGYYFSFIILFIWANILSNYPIKVIPIVIASWLLVWQVTTLKINNVQNCLIRFKNNNYVGLILVIYYFYAL